MYSGMGKRGFELGRQLGLLRSVTGCAEKMPDDSHGLDIDAAVRSRRIGDRAFAGIRCLPELLKAELSDAAMRF